MISESHARFDSVTRSVAAASGATYLATVSFDLGSPDLYAQRDPNYFDACGADRMGRLLAEALLRLSPWQEPGVK